MLDFIKICFRDKDIDYYICFFVNDSGNSKVLYDEGENYVMFNELGKYYVVGVSECERRFYIYQFNIVEIKR